MEDHEVFSEVTGGRPVFTSAAVSGEAPGPQERSGVGNREGAPSPARSCAGSDQAGSLGTAEKTACSVPDQKCNLLVTFKSVGSLKAGIFP